MTPGHLAIVDSIGGRVGQLERRVEALSAISKPSGLAVAIELRDRIASLERRVDGLEAVAGELRARVDNLDALLDAVDARVARVEWVARASLEELERRVLELERDR